ncbi:hypothetical protein EMCRGX_G022636 [Ephydatia muelleri]
MARCSSSKLLSVHTGDYIKLQPPFCELKYGQLLSIIKSETGHTSCLVQGSDIFVACLFFWTERLLRGLTLGFNVSRVGPNLYDYLLLRLVLVDCRSSLAIKLQVIQKTSALQSGGCWFICSCLETITFGLTGCYRSTDLRPHVVSV